VNIPGRGVVSNFISNLTAPAGMSKERAYDLVIAPGTKPGRYVFAVRTRDDSGAEGCDCYFAVDVVSP
jgi:hypothetical protein